MEVNPVIGREQIELLPGMMVRALLEVALFPIYYESSALIPRPGCLWRENEAANIKENK